MVAKQLLEHIQDLDNLYQSASKTGIKFNFYSNSNSSLIALNFHLLTDSKEHNA